MTPAGPASAPDGREAAARVGQILTAAKAYGREKNTWPTATGTGTMAGVTCVMNVASITAQGTVTVSGL